MQDKRVDRRSLLAQGMVGGMTVLGGTLAGAPVSSAAGQATGYEMPLESAPHERTFMQWPNSSNCPATCLTLVH